MAIPKAPLCNLVSVKIKSNCVVFFYFYLHCSHPYMITDLEPCHMNFPLLFSCYKEHLAQTADPIARPEERQPIARVHERIWWSNISPTINIDLLKPLALSFICTLQEICHVHFPPLAQMHTMTNFTSVPMEVVSFSLKFVTKK